MQKKKTTSWLSIKELIIYTLVIFSGFLFVQFIWQTAEQQEKDHVLQIASLIEANLPKEELNQLGKQTEDFSKNNYPQLKIALQRAIQINKNARVAYLYLERNNKLYFVADSEPETSPDYSPAGQEFTEADPIDKKPLTDGKAQVTKPLTDRWGTWVSAEVPVKDPQSGKVIAVLVWTTMRIHGETIFGLKYHNPF